MKVPALDELNTVIDIVRMMSEKGTTLQLNNENFGRSLEKVKELYFRMYGRGNSETTKRKYDKEVNKKISKFQTEKK
jgi:hypothetical protein